ncbi:MAG: hypothetical protein AAGA30_13025 [Planctomycetota bacterium]
MFKSVSKLFSISFAICLLLLFGSRISLAQSRIPLKDAIEKFNKKAKGDRIGKTQPALTVEEVLAAIRMSRGDLARYAIPDEAKGEYLEIENELSIEELDKFESTNRWGSFEIKGEVYTFDVWWIDLRIKRHEIADGFGRKPSHFNIRIRENAISSRKLTPEESAQWRKKVEENEIDMAIRRAELMQKRGQTKRETPEQKK